MNENKQALLAHRHKRRYSPSHPTHRRRAWSDFIQKDISERKQYIDNRRARLATALGLNETTSPLASDKLAEEWWENNLFSVVVHYLDASHGKRGRLRLEVIRQDGQAVRDWRDMQRIKNELVGPEREAVELYPAVSRLHDTANTYHLWVAEEGEQWDVGWPDGLVTSSATASRLGSTQRDYNIEDPMRAVSHAGDKAFLAHFQQNRQNNALSSP